MLMQPFPRRQPGPRNIAIASLPLLKTLLTELEAGAANMLSTHAPAMMPGLVLRRIPPDRQELTVPTNGITRRMLILVHLARPMQQKLRPPDVVNVDRVLEHLPSAEDALLPSVVLTFVTQVSVVPAALL